jgi:putative ABC transport system permease protein
MFKNYFKIALRSIIRSKVYSFINIFGLSIGLTMCMLITLYVKDELSFDRFQANGNRIFRVMTEETSPEGNVNKFGYTGMRHGASFQRQVPEIEHLVRIQGERFNIRHNNEVLTQEAMKVDSSFFSIFSADFVEGSAYKALNDPQSVVISEDVAKRFFGSEKALNKTLELDDSEKGFQPFKVSGVVKKSPENSTIQIQLLMPFHHYKKEDDQWINFYLNTFFTLRPNANIKAVEAKFNKIYESEGKEQRAEALKNWNYKNKLVFKSQPFLTMHLDREVPAGNGIKDSGNPMLSYVLSGLALFILLIACFNFINIAIARSVQRAKEIGIRKVVGSQRGQLIFQFLAESFILNLLAFALAILWVNLTLPIFNELTTKALSFTYLLDFKLLSIYFLIFVLTGFLAGFYPALVLSGFRPVETLYGRFRFAGKNLLQKTLIVIQFGLAIFFVVMTIVTYQQINLFTSRNLGYDDKNLLVVRTGDINNSRELLCRELSKYPSIEKVTAKNGGFRTTMSQVNGTQEMGHNILSVDDNYLNTINVKMAAGRNFSKDFPGDSVQSVVVNEAFVKEAGWKEPIGQTVKLYHQHPYKVVGVVKNYHFESLYTKIAPQLMIQDVSRGGFGELWIKLKGQNIPKELKDVQKVIRQLLPNVPFDYGFKAEENLKNYDNEQRTKTVIMYSAILTIIISCMGLLGLSILAAEKRTKEIGIRKVLGASVLSIVQKLSTEFVMLIGLAFLIAAPIAYMAAESGLENYPFRITISPWVFIITLLVAMGVGLSTISYQAIKSALANPVKSLRTE